MSFAIVWDNGHATGQLYGEYDTEAEAEAAGKEWCDNMTRDYFADCKRLGIEPITDEPYSYKVVESNEP